METESLLKLYIVKFLGWLEENMLNALTVRSVFLVTGSQWQKERNHLFYKEILMELVD